MKGKSLAVFASAVNVKANDATMNATLNHARPRQAPRRLRHRRWTRTSSSTSGATCASSCRPRAASRRPSFPQILDVQDDPRFTGNEQLLDTSFPGLFRVQDVAVPVRVEPLAQDGQAARREDASRHALVARRGAPDGRHASTSSRSRSGRSKLKGLQQQQFAHRGERRGHARSPRSPSGDKQGVDAPDEERQAGARLRARVVAVPREPARPRRQRPGHGPVRADDAEPRRRRAAPHARRARTRSSSSPGRSSSSRTRSTG